MVLGLLRHFLTLQSGLFMLWLLRIFRMEISVFSDLYCCQPHPMQQSFKQDKNAKLFWKASNYSLICNTLWIWNCYCILIQLCAPTVISGHWIVNLYRESDKYQLFLPWQGFLNCLISFKEKDTHLYKPAHYFLNIKEYPFPAYVIPEAMDLLGCLTIRQEHNLLLRDIFEARFFKKFFSPILRMQWIQELGLASRIVSYFLTVPLGKEGVRGAEEIADTNRVCLNSLPPSIWRHEPERSVLSAYGKPAWVPINR